MNHLFATILLLAALLFGLTTFAQKTDFDAEIHPEAPDYTLQKNWSALPFRDDVADVLPEHEVWVHDSLKAVDVFYVHPTIYRKGPLWNASLDMKKINRRVDKYPVRLQASVFNASCRVFAPRYRQAIVEVFYKPSDDGNKALDLAYSDVKRAFEYYLEHENKGRPFIIAGHSQGTHHTKRLLKELIDTTDLRNRMVAAYVIGLRLTDGLYENLTLCQDSIETGCYITWQSYRKGYTPTWRFHKGTQSINPLTWTTDTSLVTRAEYAETVVFNPKRIRTRPMKAQIKDVGGKVLWVETKAPWFRMMKNLHVADYGLFWGDIRKNVNLRVRTYLDQSD